MPVRAGPASRFQDRTVQPTDIAAWRTLLLAKKLLSQAETVDNLTITLKVALLQIVKLTTTLTDHLQEASP